MTDVRKLSDLLKIADRAIALVTADEERKTAQRLLDDAYKAWKERHDIEHVERDTLDWSHMTLATKGDYEVLVAAKDAERNAKKRLETVVRRYRSDHPAFEDVTDALRRKD